MKYGETISKGYVTHIVGVTPFVMKCYIWVCGVGKTQFFIFLLSFFRNKCFPSIKTKNLNFSRFRVAQEVLQLPVFSSPFPSHHCFQTDYQKIFRSLLSFVSQEACDQDRTHFTGHTKNLTLKIVS